MNFLTLLNDMREMMRFHNAYSCEISHWLAREAIEKSGYFSYKDWRAFCDSDAKRLGMRIDWRPYPQAIEVTIVRLLSINF
jgi:hypothetical protein